MKKRIALLVLSFVLLLSITVTATELKQAQVVRVIDGDTIEVRLQDGDNDKVRYIGIDTPETHGEDERYGEEATSYNKALVENKTVWLQMGEEVRDIYDRLLAYVYLDHAKKSMVNAILVAQGYAEVMTIEPNDKFADTFEELASDARDEERGMWGEENGAEEVNNTEEEVEGIDGCVKALNEASQEDYEEVYGIGEGIAERLVDAQPFESCSDVSCIEKALKDVGYVGETRSEDILKHFCPELVE